MSNLKPNTNELAQCVVDNLNNNTCQICHSKLDYLENDICQVCRVNLLEENILQFRKGFERVASVSKTIRSPQDQTLIDALKILARDIQSEDGVANACIYEASQRLDQLT